MFVFTTEMVMKKVKTKQNRPSGEAYSSPTQDNWNSNKPTVMKYDSIINGVNELRKSRQSICPNPTSTPITIETPTKDSLIILTLNGKQLLQQTISEPSTAVDVCGLKSGVYFVKLVEEKGMQVGKFIKK